MPYCKLKNCYKFTKLWYKNYKNHRDSTKIWTKITKITETVPNFGTKITKITETVQNFGKSFVCVFVVSVQAVQQWISWLQSTVFKTTKEEVTFVHKYVILDFKLALLHVIPWILPHKNCWSPIDSPFWSFYLDTYFKEEAKFYFKDHQCIQALPLGLKMSMVPTQYNLERKQHKYWKKTIKIRFVKHVGIQDSDLHLFRFNRPCAFFW